MNCAFPEIPICLILCVIFCGISIYKDFSIKFIIIAFIIVLYIPIKLNFDSESYEQCKIQQEKERIENDKQLLLNNLESGQCGDVCIKESNSKHSTKFSHYIMCDVSIRICK